MSLTSASGSCCLPIIPPKIKRAINSTYPLPQEAHHRLLPLRTVFLPKAPLCLQLHLTWHSCMGGQSDPNPTPVPYPFTPHPTDSVPAISDEPPPLNPTTLFLASWPLFTLGPLPRIPFSTWQSHIHHSTPSSLLSEETFWLPPSSSISLSVPITHYMGTFLILCHSVPCIRLHHN